MKKLIAALLALLGIHRPAAADDAESRKARSIALLRSEGISFIARLPAIEPVSRSVRRAKQDVVRRAIALAIVSVKGETGDHDLTRRIVEQFDAADFFTPAERAFVDDPEPSDRDRAQFTWRYEGVHVMLWALGIFDELGRPDEICDVPLIAATLRDLDAQGLASRGRLRPQAQILDAADLIYRYHWAVANARLKGEAAPGGLDAGVVRERHHALNWLVGYGNQDWDDISTDS